MNNHAPTSPTDIRKKRFSKLAFLCAVSGATIIIACTIIAGLNFPNYSHITQSISELGARNAPNEYLVRYGGFLSTGIVLCLFSLFALLSLPKSRMTTIGLLGLCYFPVSYVAAAFFPCDLGCSLNEPSLSQLIHSFISGIGHIAAPLGLMAISTQPRKWTNGNLLALLSFILGVIALLTSLFTVDFSGLTERIAEVCLLAWMVYCGYYLTKNDVEELYF